jgi:hypothetical protein
MKRRLLFSGQAATLDLLEGARAQGYDFRLLQKPVHPSEFLSEIGQLSTDTAITFVQGVPEGRFRAVVSRLNSRCVSPCSPCKSVVPQFHDVLNGFPPGHPVEMPLRTSGA